MTDTYQRLFAWLDHGGAVFKKKESRYHMIIYSQPHRRRKEIKYWMRCQIRVEHISQFLEASAEKRMD